VQDLGGWQDDHAEKDLEESQRGSGQDAPASAMQGQRVLQECCRSAPRWRTSFSGAIGSAMPEHRGLKNPRVDQKVDCF
jgi:hypothetical protein